MSPDFHRGPRPLVRSSPATSPHLSGAFSATDPQAALRRPALRLPAALRVPMAGHPRSPPPWPVLPSPPTPRLRAPGHSDTCDAGGQGSMRPRPKGPPVAAATSLRRSTTAPTTPTLPRTLQPLLRARPPKLASAVTCMASSSPTSRTGDASFTARGLRLSPGGTGSSVLAATGAVIRVVPRPQSHARAFHPSTAGSQGPRVHWAGARSFIWTIAWCTHRRWTSACSTSGGPRDRPPPAAPRQELPVRVGAPGSMASSAIDPRRPASRWTRARCSPSSQQGLSSRLGRDAPAQALPADIRVGRAHPQRVAAACRCQRPGGGRRFLHSARGGGGVFTPPCTSMFIALAGW